MPTLSKKTWKLTKENKQEIIEKYRTGKYTQKALAEEYGVRAPSVTSLLKTNIRPRKTCVKTKIVRQYLLNENYFDVIDTEDKAYFLGLLYADGYNTGRSGIILTLQAQDKAILDAFCHHVGSTLPLKFLSGQAAKRKDKYRFAIYSKHIVQQLTKLGCMQNKTFLIDFPTRAQVPEHLVRHFVRGYLDGDGCICNSQSKDKKTNRVYPTTCCTIVSSHNFCIGLAEHITAKFAFSQSVYVLKNPKTAKVAVYHGKAIRFLDWLYEGSTIFLHRKYNKYVDARKTAIERGWINVTKN